MGYVVLQLTDIKGTNKFISSLNGSTVKTLSELKNSKKLMQPGIRLVLYYTKEKRDLVSHE